MTKKIILWATAVSFVFLASCALKPDTLSLISPDPSTIVPSKDLFSPTGSINFQKISFNIVAGNAADVSRWSIRFSKLGSTLANEGNSFLVESASRVPDTITWDGKTTSGLIASEGNYVANLTTRYSTKYTEGSAISTPFKLAGPPTGDIVMQPSTFNPKAGEKLSITLLGKSTFGTIQTWSFEIMDPERRPYKTWSGKWPAGKLTWDGKNSAGVVVSSATAYPAELKLVDNFGNTGIITNNALTDVIVDNTPSGMSIKINNIIFKPNTADFLTLDARTVAQNKQAIAKLVDIFKKNSNYTIKIVGHAVTVNYYDKAKADLEQERELIPLSQSRARAIKNALVASGISADRIITDGVGNLNPIVPDSDLQNRWQNRRVEFLLTEN